MKLRFGLIILAASLMSSCAHDRNKPHQAGVLANIMDMSDTIGVQEMVLNVADVDQVTAIYQTIGDLEALSTSDVDEAQLILWGLPPSKSAEQIVLGNPGHETGLLRIVQIDDGNAPEIRPSARPFDTGSIFNINMFAKDMDSTFATMRKLGFVGFAEPSRYTLFGKNYAGAILSGHDGVVVNLLSRLDQSYDDIPPFVKVSHVLNSTQMVNDFDGHKEFYRDKLGFQIKWEAEPTWRPNGNNNFSLPNSIVQSGVIRQKAISFALDKNQKGGTIEVFTFEGLSGRDFSDNGKMPNRGIAMYNIHQNDLERYRQQITAKGVEVSPPATQPLAKFNLPPYGDVRAFTIFAPEGAQIQFFEQIRP